MKHAIEVEVCSIISKTLNIPAETISLADPITGLAADSLQLFELLLALEAWYEEAVDYEDLASIATVGDIVSYVAVRKGFV
jgi:acyl carrier protein